MFQKWKSFFQKKPERMIFIISFFFLFILGILLTYNYQMKDNFNLLFDSDTSRVIKDAIEIGEYHYRVNVHPLFVLLIQPICLLLSGLFLNKILSILFLSSLVSSLTIVYLYKIGIETGNSKLSSFLLSFIYLFSFSNMIFTSGVETYNFAAFFLVLLWYYFIKKEKNFTKDSYIILILLGILSFAFTITNILVFFIVLFFLWTSKKIPIKQAILVVLITLISVFGLNVFQKLVWNNTPPFWKTSISGEAMTYGENKISFEKIKNVIENDYYHSLISPNVELKVQYATEYNGQNYVISFQRESIASILLISLFYFFLIYFLIRNFKQNKVLNSALLLTLLFNTSLHILYGNEGAFLYSLHFLYVIMLLFLINYAKEKNQKSKRIGKYFFLGFLVIEIIQNTNVFHKILGYVNDNISKNYLLATLGNWAILLEISLIILAFGGILLGCYFFKKFQKEKNKERKIILGASLFGIFIAIECLFIIPNSMEIQDRFLWMKLERKSNIVEPKKKKDYISKSFQETFQEELKQLELYQQEYLEFQKNYDVEKVHDTNWSDYYFFGLGNRRKLLYQPNHMIDIDTKEVLEEFHEKEHFIIPNLYTVVIETEEGDYIKIIEKEDGVHFILNEKDKIIEGTNVNINLYTFDNQKYSNMKKVLYGEILWNIKDSIIYPNIIVYKSPWYRDAAMASMVLKETNNTDLIKEWVEKITEIYDKQNAGIEEPDNLGELLYILSTQQNIRQDLVDRIEEEARRIARNNPNGYYLYGKTDFGEKYLYQNLWYQIGIESVGRSFNFDLSNIPEDDYAKLAWWSSYSLKDNSFYGTVKDYPYLSYAAKHKQKEGTIIINENLYPLSWEINASEANYENFRGIEDGMANNKVSPLHTWSASEFLLWLLEETGDLSR